MLCITLKELTNICLDLDYSGVQPDDSIVIVSTEAKTYRYQRFPNIGIVDSSGVVHSLSKTQS